MASAAIMLPYTIKSGLGQGVQPVVVVGLGTSQQRLGPSTSLDDSYWWYFLDNATQKMVFNVQVPGSSNTSVPSGVDTYMTNPDIFFGVTTQSLSTLHVPQGALYDYLVSHGAGAALNMLEQTNATLSCGYFGQVSYILMGQGGAVGGPIPPPSYEDSSLFNDTLIQMSLMSMPNGQPPYALVDEYTFQ